MALALGMSLPLPVEAGTVAANPVGAPGERLLRDDRLLVGGRVALRPGSGRPWVVRCVAEAAAVGASTCRYRSLAQALQGTAPGDLVLIGRGSDLELGGQSLVIPRGVQVVGAGGAPILPTTSGPISLAGLLQEPRDPLRQGVLVLSGGNRIRGLRFVGVTLRSQQPPGARGETLEISNNHFDGSYSDNPGGLSPRALPTIWLQGGEGLLLASNHIRQPEVRSLLSALGSSDADPTSLVSVCGSGRRSKRPAGQQQTCLSGNAIRLDHTGTTTVVGNRVIGALDEAIRIENPKGTIQVAGNQIDAMRQGPDSNMQAAIFTRVTEGNARVTIRHNVITANAPGLFEPAAGPQALEGALLWNQKERNLIDPIEIGLCRGDQTFSRAEDKYGDPDYGSGDCKAPSTLALVVEGNRLRPGRSSDADGIDYNIGRGGRLEARTLANRVDEIGEDNSAYTVDLRGDGQLQETIRANQFRADTGISIELGNRGGVPFNIARLKALIESNWILADTHANPRQVGGKPEDNEAVGIEIAAQGSNGPSKGFAIDVALRKNRITVVNQPGNPASEGFGIWLGSSLFLAKDGKVLQQGRLSSGTFAASLVGNQVAVTQGIGSGNAYGLRQVVAQGRYRATVDLGPGNSWRMQGPSAKAILLDPSPLP